MSEEYNFVAKGKLKLKNDSEIKKKKKKKSKNKDKDLEKLQRAFNESLDDETQKPGASGLNYERKLTKAELAFKEQQEKMKNKRIMERASTTHKQRVEKFNEHLDTLTEHFDIPKVSWTK